MTARRLTQFAVLLALWLVLSGHFNPLSIGMGVASAALGVWLFEALRRPELDSGRRYSPAEVARRVYYSAIYLAWLISRIPPSGIEVAYHVLHPRVPIEPSLVRFRTGLASPVARTILANSITLVPGTMTVMVDGDEFLVHAFVPSAADDLIDATMQNRIADAFLEEHDPAPEVVWEPRWRVTE